MPSERLSKVGHSAVSQRRRTSAEVLRLHSCRPAAVTINSTTTAEDDDIAASLVGNHEQKTASDIMRADPSTDAEEF